jgi:pyruvate, orthophosphate dikinase
MRVDGKVLAEGDPIAINGTSGVVTVEDVPLVEAELDEHFQAVLGWSDVLRRLEVRANADRPADAEAERRASLAELEPLQQGDFEGLFAAMAGLPATIRLLDPPLHEFRRCTSSCRAPRTWWRKIERRHAGGGEVAGLERELHRVRQLEETNPMLGTRGCRLGLLFPEIYEMQVSAIAAAAIAVRGGEGDAPRLEIMIPLVDYEGELRAMRELVERSMAAAAERLGAEPLSFAVGTMIELPRACLVADRLAAEAAFFSFGTNDLTQTALGFSRDDSEGRFLSEYLRRRIVDRSPFETIDVEGVGELLATAVERGRRQRPELCLGICGEHGGDPDSIAFFHRAGLDYVSCSPFRVPIARVAAAQAAIADPEAARRLDGPICFNRITRERRWS